MLYQMDTNTYYRHKQEQLDLKLNYSKDLYVYNSLIIPMIRQSFTKI